MPTPRLRLLATAALALAAPALVAGCSSTPTSGAEPSATASSQALFSEQCQGTVIPSLPDLPPVSEGSGTKNVSTQFGDVELPVAPQDALGMYTTDVDILVWLRYPLADSQPIRGDSGYTTFPCFFPYQALAGLKTFANYPDFNYEAILAAKPDFILNGLGYDTKVVKRLADIAPTYSVDAFDGTSWQTHFKQTAAALGRSQYYDQWEELYQQRLAEVKARIGDPASITVAPVGFWEGKANTGCYTGVECQVFEDLGLTIAPVALTNNREGEALSGEQIGKLAGIDYAFSTKGLGETGQKEFDAVMAEAAKNPLWNELDFVANDHIVTYEMEMTYGSPSGQLAFLDVVEKALGS